MLLVTLRSIFIPPDYKHNTCVLRRPQSHDARVMARWEAQQAQWRAQAAALCAVTGKDEQHLTLCRGAYDSCHAGTSLLVSWF